MFKRLIKVLCVLALTVFGVSVVFACKTTDNSVRFVYESGERLPVSIQLELGDLYPVPDVTARVGSKEYEVSALVTDKNGEEVKLINGKFRPTDMAGYKMTFSATINERQETITVDLIIKDTVAPTFTVFGTSGSVVLLGSTVSVPECKVNDASSSDLQASYSVTSPSGDDVTVTDGMFSVDTIGRYTVTYQATDASGNVGRQEFVFSCKNAKILNAFDSVETSVSDWTFARFERSMWSVDTEYAVEGNAVRFDVGQPSDGVSNWCYLFVKCLKEDGTPYTFKEFTRFAGVQISVYSSGINELDLVMETGYTLKAGANTIYYSMDRIIAMMPYGNDQYTEQNGFILNLKSAVPGEFLVFDNLIGIYADDYVEPPNYTYEDGSDLPEQFTAECPGEFVLPEVLAIRNGESIDFTVTVKDSSGSEVSFAENKFAVTDVNGYTVEYSANDGSAVLIIPVRVMDFTTPVIILSGVGQELVLGSEVTVPAATVEMRGENLEAAYTVAGPVGAVSVTDGKFVMDTLGDYTITYTATSAVYNKTATKYCVFTAYEDDGSVRLNDFIYSYELVWTGIAFSPEAKQLVDGGIRIVRENDNRWISIVVMLTENGVILTYDQLMKFSKIEVTVMTDYDTQLGLYTTDFAELTANQKTVLTFTRSQIAESQSAYSGQQYDANGFWFNLKDGQAGQSITFYSIVGYGRTEFFDGEGNPLSGETEIEYGKEYTPPVVIAKCDGKAVEVECVVKDSEGITVELTDNAFFADDPAGYTFNYSAVTDYGTATFTVNVITVDARVPKIDIEGYKTFAPIGEYTLPCATASMQEEIITPTVTVTDENGNELTVTEGRVRFAAKGMYTITYKAVSALNGKEGTASFNVNAVRGDILTNGDNTKDIQWTNYVAEKEMVVQNGILGVKFTVASGSLNWARTCIPLYSNGTYLSVSGLKEYSAVQIRIYLSAKHRVGLVNGADWYEAGWNTITFTKAQIASALIADGSQYSADANGWYLNTDPINENDYFILESIIGIYADDYVPTMIFSSDVTSAVATVGSIFTVEEITAMRYNSDTPAVVTYSVFDSEGTQTEATGGVFAVTDPDGYRVVYTASDALGDATFTVRITTRRTDVLNGFTTAGAYMEDGCYFFPAAVEYEKTAEGVKVTLSDTSWSYATFILKRNGVILTKEKLLKVEKIEIEMYSSIAVTNFGLAEILGKSLIAGRNVVTFTAAELESAKYDANGLWLQFNATTAGETFTMVSITAVYPAGYDPDAREGVVLNSFGTGGFYAEDGVYYCQFGASATKTEDGVKVEENDCSWAYFTLLLKRSGVRITAEELKSFTFVELTVISSCEVARFGIADVCDKQLGAGRNVVVFTAAELENAQYDANGLWLQLGTGKSGEYLTFVSVIGYND